MVQFDFKLRSFCLCRFKDYAATNPDDQYKYSYNPCEPFSETAPGTWEDHCYAVAVRYFFCIFANMTDFKSASLLLVLLLTLSLILLFLFLFVLFKGIFGLMNCIVSPFFPTFQSSCVFNWESQSRINELR